MDKIVTTMHTQINIISQLAEDLEIARLCGDDETIAKVHFVQHKMSKTISPATEKEFHLAAELLVRRLKDNGFAIPELTADNSIINIDLGTIGIEVYRHDYLGNGYFRFVMNGQKSAEYKISISTEQLAETIANLPVLVANWLETDFAEAKSEAHKLTKQQKISKCCSCKRQAIAFLHKLQRFCHRNRENFRTSKHCKGFFFEICECDNNQ